MLVPMSVPLTTGYSDTDVPSVNAGQVENKGLELTLASQNVKGEFEWNTDFNISFNKNEIVKMNVAHHSSQGLSTDLPSHKSMLKGTR